MEKLARSGASLLFLAQAVRVSPEFFMSQVLEEAVLRWLVWHHTGSEEGSTCDSRSSNIE